MGFKAFLIGIGLAIFSAIFLKESSLGIFLFLVGISIAGILGTAFILIALIFGLPFANIFLQVSIGFGPIKIPLIIVWIALDILSFFFGFLTFGIGSIIFSIIKLVIVFFFGYKSISEFLK